MKYYIVLCNISWLEAKNEKYGLIDLFGIEF
jgi:hypothetical protein